MLLTTEPPSHPTSGFLSGILKNSMIFESHRFFFLSVLCFKTRSYEEAQAGLELVMWPKMTLNSQSSCLYLPSPGITGVCHHSWLQGDIYLKWRHRKNKWVKVGRAKRIPLYFWATFLAQFSQQRGNLDWAQRYMPVIPKAKEDEAGGHDLMLPCTT